MLLERYALMKNQLVVTKRDARSDLDAVPADELSNFGAAYTVADLQAFRPPQVLFTANSDGSSDDPRTWWGKFRLDLGFSVPPNCWNTGREIRNHKACEAGPVTTLRWVSTSKKTNHNDGATCTQWAPTAAPTRAPTAAPTATPTAPTLAPTLAPSLTHSPTVVWNDGIGDFACTERLLQVLKPEGEDNFDVVEYSGQVVGATNACGSLHLGWKFTSADSEFLALIVRRSSEDESARVFRVGSPATAAMAALLLHASSKL